MARYRNQDPARRQAVPSRVSPAVAPTLQKLTGLAEAARGTGQIMQGVIKNAGTAVSGFIQQRDENLESAGALEATRLDMNGGKGPTDTALETFAPSFRRGYRRVQAANQIDQAARDLTRAMAEQEPDADPTEAIQGIVSPLLEGSAFQDPTLRAELLPRINNMQREARDVYAKNEIAELVARQDEELTGLARSGVASGELLTQEGINNFLALGNSEDMGFLTDEAMLNTLSHALTGALESGDMPGAEALELMATLKTPDGTPLLDRRDANGNRWADMMENAIGRGEAVRKAALEERRASVMAEHEIEWQKTAYNGRMYENLINQNADSLGLTGDDRLSFVRHWYNQQEAGLARLRAEAERRAAAARERQAMLMGDSWSLTNSTLQKHFAERWEASYDPNNPQASLELLREATSKGIYIPQVSNIFTRVNEQTLPKIAELHNAIKAVSPFMAAGYMPEESAYMINDAIVSMQHGMSAPEALRVSLNSRPGQPNVQQAERRITSAFTAFSKKPPELPDGLDKLPEVAGDVIRQMAVSAVADNPALDPTTALETAQARYFSRNAVINGRVVPSGGIPERARPVMTEIVNGYGQAHRKDFPEIHDKLSLVLDTSDPSGTSYLIAGPTGMPIEDPRTSMPVVIKPDEDAARLQGIRRQRALHQAQVESQAAASRGQSFMGQDVRAAAQARTTRGTGPTPRQQDLPRSPRRRTSTAADEQLKATNEFTEFFGL